MWQVAAMAGLKGLQAYAQYKSDKAIRNAKEAWRNYSNTMLNISDAMNQNVITQNQANTELAFREQAIGIQQSEILTAGQAEVAAASAGVKGRSVNQAMRDIQRNAAAAEVQRQQELIQSRLAFNSDRLRSKMSAKMQQDHTYLPKPSGASYLLDAAASTFSFGSSGGYF